MCRTALRCHSSWASDGGSRDAGVRHRKLSGARDGGVRQVHASEIGFGLEGDAVMNCAESS